MHCSRSQRNGEKTGGRLCKEGAEPLIQATVRKGWGRYGEPLREEVGYVT